VAISGMKVLEKISPSGPCNPGLGVLAFLLFIPLVAILIIRIIYLAFARNKKYRVILASHLLIIALFIILSYIGIL
jgi:hypothetical protein